MGYRIDVEITDLVIPANKVKACLAAINFLHDESNRGLMNGGNFLEGGERWYRFVRNPLEGGFKTLDEALRAWRYSTDLVDGDIIVRKFLGEKMAQCEVLYAIIAKYVKEDGRKIKMIGDDGAEWFYRFLGGIVFKEIDN